MAGADRQGGIGGGPSRLRFVAMAAAGAALLAAMTLGLVRIGWAVPGVPAAAAAGHGGLMVSGFLGTLIAVERAVGLGRGWAYAAPALAAAGTVVLLAGVRGPAGPALFAAAAAALVGIFVAIYRIRPGRPSATLAVGAAAWLAGNLWWVGGAALPRLVPWWAAFLVLTIAGERLELAHIRRRPGAADALFAGAAAAVLAGSLGVAVGLPVGTGEGSVAVSSWGVGLAGVGMAALGAWLVRYDIAWRTVRIPGLSRYIAWCLLPGYVWLVLGGVLWIAWPGRFGAGIYYDAMLHAVFLGFVMSMIFGHAPVIVPAVLGAAVPFAGAPYVPLVLLHASLVLRVAGDVVPVVWARQWGGLLNVAAVLMFFALVARAVRAGRRAATVRRAPTTSPVAAGARDSAGGGGMPLPG